MGCPNPGTNRGLCWEHGASGMCRSVGCYSECAKNTAKYEGYCAKHFNLLQKQGERCREPGCSDLIYVRDVCYAHSTKKVCADPGCDDVAFAFDLCKTHGKIRMCPVPGCVHFMGSIGFCVSHKYLATAEAKSADRDLHALERQLGRRAKGAVATTADSPAGGSTAAVDTSDSTRRAANTVQSPFAGAGRPPTTFGTGEVLQFEHVDARQKRKSGKQMIAVCKVVDCRSFAQGTLKLDMCRRHVTQWLTQTGRLNRAERSMAKQHAQNGSERVASADAGASAGAGAGGIEADDAGADNDVAMDGDWTVCQLTNTRNVLQESQMLHRGSLVSTATVLSHATHGQVAFVHRIGAWITVKALSSGKIIKVRRSTLSGAVDPSRVHNSVASFNKAVLQQTTGNLEDQATQVRSMASAEALSSDFTTDTPLPTLTTMPAALVQSSLSCIPSMASAEALSPASMDAPLPTLTTMPAVLVQSSLELPTKEEAEEVDAEVVVADEEGGGVIDQPRTTANVGPGGAHTCGGGSRRIVLKPSSEDHDAEEKFFKNATAACAFLKSGKSQFYSAMRSRKAYKGWYIVDDGKERQSSVAAIVTTTTTSTAIDAPPATAAAIPSTAANDDVGAVGALNATSDVASINVEQNEQKHPAVRVSEPAAKTPDVGVATQVTDVGVATQATGKRADPNDGVAGVDAGAGVGAGTGTGAGDGTGTGDGTGDGADNPHAACADSLALDNGGSNAAAD